MTVQSEIEEALAALDRARAEVDLAYGILAGGRRGPALAAPVSTEAAVERIHWVLARNGPLRAETLWGNLRPEARAALGSMERMEGLMAALPRFASRTALRGGRHWGLESWMDVVWGPRFPGAAPPPAERPRRPAGIVAKTLDAAERLIREKKRGVSLREIAEAVLAEHGYSPSRVNISGYMSSARHRFRSSRSGWLLGGRAVGSAGANGLCEIRKEGERA